MEIKQEVVDMIDKARKPIDLFFSRTIRLVPSSGETIFITHPLVKVGHELLSKTYSYLVDTTGTFSLPVVAMTTTLCNGIYRNYYNSFTIDANIEIDKQMYGSSPIHVYYLRAFKKKIKPKNYAKFKHRFDMLSPYMQRVWMAGNHPIYFLKTEEGEWAVVADDLARHLSWLLSQHGFIKTKRK